MKREVSLYRLFDENGVLLYVGITFVGLTRIATHMRERAWARRIRKIQIEDCSDLAAARQLERDAVRSEHPRYNINLQPRPEPDARYREVLRASKEDGYFTLTQAAIYLGVRQTAVAQLVKNGVLPATTSHLDKRLKLVRKSDLDKLNSEPRPSPRNEPAA